MKLIYILILFVAGAGYLYSGPAAEYFGKDSYVFSRHESFSRNNPAYYSETPAGSIIFLRNSITVKSNENDSKIYIEFKNALYSCELQSAGRRYEKKFYTNKIIDDKIYTEKLLYKNIYENIDLVIYTNKDGKPELDFIIAPGADPDNIIMEVSSAVKMEISNTGSINFKNNDLHMEMFAPVSYQVINGNRQFVKSSFNLEDDKLKFNIDDYDKSLALVIDPVIRIWGTYYGGELEDIGKCLAADWNGYVYLCGETKSYTGIATEGAHQEEFAEGHKDVFVTKFDLNGNRLWSTYIGGGSSDIPTDIVLDKSGSIYICGLTKSSEGIAYMGHQNNCSNVEDAFLVKLDKDGNRLWGTYYGGFGSDMAYAVDVDASRNVFITGSTTSDDHISTENSYQPGRMKNDDNEPDAFLAKFSSKGELLWGTYFGGHRYDEASGIAIDIKGNVLLCGTTFSLDFIGTEGAHNENLNGEKDAFFAKFDTDGNRLYASYFGGNNNDVGNDIDIDYGGNFYLCGYSHSNEGILLNSEEDFAGVIDSYIAKFDSDGKQLWGRYYGGSGDDRAYNIDIDISSNIYLTGYTKSSDGIATVVNFPTSTPEHDDGFLAKFDDDGNRLWSLYYGGSFYDYGYDVAVDNDKNIFICGMTRSSDGIFENGFKEEYIADDGDAYLARIADDDTYIREIDPEKVEENINPVNKLNIYPNPVTLDSKVSFNATSAFTADVYISDMEGNKSYLMKSRWFNEGKNVLDAAICSKIFANLSSGNYILTIECVQGEISSLKFSILK